MLPPHSSLRLEDADHVFIPVHVEVFVVKLELAPAILRNNDLVPNLDTHGYKATLFVQSARTNSNDHGLVDLLLCRVWQQNTARSLGLGLELLYQHAVQQGDKALDCSSHGEGRVG